MVGPLLVMFLVGLVPWHDGPQDPWLIQV